MHILEEMRGLQKGGHPVEGVVIHQHGAQQRLLRLDVVRRHAIFATSLIGGGIVGDVVIGVKRRVHGPLITRELRFLKH